MVPRPRFATWEECNAHLLMQCQRRRERKLRGHQQTIGERFEKDREQLLPLPAAPYEACEKRSTRVTSMSLVRTSDYSVPVCWGHGEVLPPAPFTTGYCIVAVLPSLSYVQNASTSLVRTTFCCCPFFV